MATGVNSDAPIFIVGCPRSGTTLLRNLLRSHPNLTFPRESYFIPTFYRSYGDPRDAAEARRLAKRILKLRWVRSWGMPMDAEAFADCRTFREVVCRLYETWARKQDKLRWGDKTPHYVTELPILLKLFPGAKIIHIYRDGRDVALSWIHGRFGPGNMYTAARLWKWYVNSGRRAGAALPKETYLEVPYEQLLQQPRETMQQVCEFVGEPFDEAVLRPSAFPPNPLNPFPIHQGALQLVRRAEIFPANSLKWQTRMPVSDRVLFESVAGDLLEILGYETEGHIRSISLPERLAWHVHQQVMWCSVRLRALNREAFSATLPEMILARVRTALRRAATQRL